MTTQKSRAYFMTLLSLSLAALVFSSCSRIAEGAIKLPANPILTGGLGWAIVKEAYVRLKESPSDSARDLDHLRRGGVFRLDEREFGAPGVGESAQDSPAIWYGLTSEGAKGWVKDSELDIYSSQAQAEKAAAVYR